MNRTFMKLPPCARSPFPFSLIVYAALAHFLFIPFSNCVSSRRRFNIGRVASKRRYPRRRGHIDSLSLSLSLSRTLSRFFIANNRSTTEVSHVYIYIPTQITAVRGQWRYTELANSLRKSGPATLRA